MPPAGVDQGTSSGRCVVCGFNSVGVCVCGRGGSEVGCQTRSGVMRLPVYFKLCSYPACLVQSAAGGGL